MAAYRFFKLDVFADKPFFGNPLAVFPEAEGISEADMQNIAREMNLSETVFVLPPEDKKALRRLRIFTPVRELPMAGHPVVGTWNLLSRLGVLPEVDEDHTGRLEIFHELGIGTLPVEIDLEWGVPKQVIMTQGGFIAGDIITDEAFTADLIDALGIERADLEPNLPIQLVATGVRSLAVPVNSLHALGKIKIDANSVAEKCLGLDAIGIYAFTAETIETAAAHARFFAPHMGILEDAATGGAAGPLAAYLVHHGVISARDNDGISRFTIEQGDFMKRPSRINAEIKGESGAVTLTKIAGASVVVAQGEMFF